MRCPKERPDKRAGCPRAGLACTTLELIYERYETLIRYNYCVAASSSTLPSASNTIVIFEVDSYWTTLSILPSNLWYPAISNLSSGQLAFSSTRESAVTASCMFPLSGEKLTLTLNSPQSYPSRLTR